MGQMPPMRTILAATAALLLAWGNATAAGVDETETAPESRQIRINILNFNRWGELANPEELELAKLQLRDFDPERVIIMCYGWGNDGRQSAATYYSLVRSLRRPEGSETVSLPRRVAVIGIGWDSAQSAISQLVENVIPFPGVAQGIAWLPDRLFFPISFWSKGAQADRMGYGGVRVALNDLFDIWPDDDDHPEILLLGHSFGTRVVSGIMNDHIGGVRVGRARFKKAKHVRGAVLLQPALPIGSLDHSAHYPLMITMSAHDHANGALYPIANIPMNTFGFTIFESLVQRLLRVEILPGDGRDEETPNDVVIFGAPAIDETIGSGRRTLGEIAALPLSLGFSLVAMPVDYLYGQALGITTRPAAHVMDTLAQIPGVQLVVAGIGRLAGRDVRWGQRSKGLLTIGPLHESVGRMVTPTLLERDVQVYGVDEIENMDELPHGPFVVDASSIVRRGIFGLDLGNPLVGSTIGWIDLIGSHSDYTNPEVVRLMMILADQAWRKTTAETAP